ncbi:MAG: hypothetical protein GY820_17930 [Gammaproteobacteria bacterium]|nr:hypothetical protein [Gammaproteobacteria bacterium]
MSTQQFPDDFPSVPAILKIRFSIFNLKYLVLDKICCHPTLIRDLDSIDPHHRLTQEKVVWERYRQTDTQTDRQTDRHLLVCGLIAIGNSQSPRVGLGARRKRASLDYS